MNLPEPSDVDHLIDPQPLPTFTKIRHEPATQTISNPADAAQAELDSLKIDRLADGATVAIGVGSRGIHAINDIVSAVASSLITRGFNPVVVPAMGSHGGATPDGQREVLKSLDISEEQVGVPIDAQMDTKHLETVSVGDTEMPVYFSTVAMNTDAIIIINRVKPHTNFSGQIESGLSKMTVVGLGKQRGAKSFHSTAISEGYVETLQTALSVIKSNTSLLGGIALVENFHERIARVEGVPVGSFSDREPALLDLAYEEMPTLPVDDVDLLVVDELGKEISGAGMDTNVIGRYRVLNTTDPDKPVIKLIYARGLTKKTKGNANGIGLADITRKAALDQLDIQKTYANALTSGSLAKAKLPVIMPDDELALRTALTALGGYSPDTVRILWIQNTQDLAEMHVSQPVLPDLPDSATVLRETSLTFTDGTASFTDS